MNCEIQLHQTRVVTRREIPFISDITCTFLIRSSGTIWYLCANSIWWKFGFFLLQSTSLKVNLWKTGQEDFSKKWIFESSIKSCYQNNLQTFWPQKSKKKPPQLWDYNCLCWWTSYQILSTELIDWTSKLWV